MSNEPLNYTDVTLSKAEWQECKGGMMLVMTGKADDGSTLTAREFVTEGYVQSGKNAGRPRSQMALERLTRFGLPNGDPAQVNALVGKQTTFAWKWDETDDGKRFQEVVFYDSGGGREAVEPSKAADIMRKMGLIGGEAKPQAQSDGTPDDVADPFGDIGNDEPVDDVPW